MQARVLGPGDERAVESFLRPRAETSMFLRSNIRLAGLEDRGEPYQGCYVGVFDDDLVTGVVSHVSPGNLVLQLPGLERDAVKLAVRLSGRPLQSMVGPWSQVTAVRSLLGLDDAATTLCSCEDLFTLELSELVVPAGLTNGQLECRRPSEEEFELLSQWTFDYFVEALHRTPTPELQDKSRESVRLLDKKQSLYILLDRGTPVAKTGFNAALPDCVQVGGVYTPPELRCRHYGRAAVAGSLLDARKQGVERSILFTEAKHSPAQRAYTALGFQRIGDYGLIQFTEPHDVR